jgi:hypothetical protein
LLATIAIVGGIKMTVAVNWENKLVCYTTNVGLFDCNGCCSTISNNGFLIVLILFYATLLSSCEIDFFSTLISNKFVRKYLIGVKNPCIGCKDCVPILVSFYSCMKFFGQDWIFPSYRFDISVSSFSLGVIDVVDYTSTSLLMDCIPSTVVYATNTNAS